MNIINTPPQQVNTMFVACALNTHRDVWYYLRHQPTMTSPYSVGIVDEGDNAYCPIYLCPDYETAMGRLHEATKGEGNGH